jgi:hypothetical protein
VVFKETDPKKEIIPWDPGLALDLWRRRSTDGRILPDLFGDPKEVTHAPQGIVGRNRLVLKPRNVAELMYYPCDDE